MIVAYTLVIQAVGIGSIYYCFALFAVPWLTEFSQNRAQVMLAITLLQVGNGVLSPFIGRAMDRFRIRNLVLLGAGIYALGYVGLANVDAFWQVYIIYGIAFPLALGLTGNLAAQVLITRWFDQQRGLALGISAMGTNLGGIVFPLVAAGAIAGGEWRAVSVNFAYVGLVVLVPLTFYVLRHKTPALANTTPSETRPRVVDIVKSRTFLICAVAFVFLNMAFNAVQTNVAVLAVDPGFGDWSGRLIALTAATMVLGKLFFGLMGDRMAHHRLFWIASGLMFLGLVLLLGTPGPVRFVGSIAIMGLAGGGLLPIIALIVGARYPLESFGQAMGLIMLMWSAGSIGPVVAGAIYDATGNYDMAFSLLAALLLPGLAAMYWLPSPLSAASRDSSHPSGA